MEPLLSVIVPVYNAAPYLPRCLDSIQKQTYRNLEIILVDDGSTDDSGNICDAYAAADNRIIVLHKENGGQSTARNAALDIARGEYIGFVDSDDYIAENMYEALYTALKTHTACDVAMCGRYTVFEDRAEARFVLNKPVIMDNCEIIRRFALSDCVDSSACDKLFQRNIIGDIRFPSGYICEDVEFVFRCLVKTKKMIHCGVPLYHYVQRKGSTSHAAFSERTMGQIYYHRDAQKYILENYPNLKKEAAFLYLSQAISVYTIMEKSAYRGSHYAEVKEIIRKNTGTILQNDFFSKIQKTEAVLVHTGMYTPARKVFHLRRKRKEKSMQKNVAIITLYGETNYGNRLQNYAVQKVMEKLGAKAETIVLQKKMPILKKLKRIVMRTAAITAPGLLAKKYPHIVREKHFTAFTKKYIPTKYIVSDKNTFSSAIQNAYDVFVVGSDQVWNPTFGGFEAQYDTMFLTFAPPAKRVCFSPSIGINQLPDAWEKKFIDGWNGFSALSVREESGAALIKKLTGREAEVLIDPTMMLDAAEWLRVAKRVKPKARPYVFEYFLGERDDEALEKLAKEKGLSRLTLLDKEDEKAYVSGPGEFIYLLANADLVCTDSFHACVFSIIFDKPFLVQNRKDENTDMFSRIDTLLQKFGVRTNENKIIQIDKKIKDETLLTERTRVNRFLSDALK